MLDQRLVFSDAQAYAGGGDFATAATHSSEKVIDLEGGSLFQSVDNQVGEGEPLILNVSVNTTVTSGGAATVEAKLQESDDNSTWSDVGITSGAIGKASLTAGAQMLKAAIPLGSRKRYLRVAYVVGTAGLTAGAFDAYLTIN